MVRLVLKAGSLVLALEIQGSERHIATRVHAVDEIPSFATGAADCFEQRFQPGIRGYQGSQMPPALIAIRIFASYRLLGGNCRPAIQKKEPRRLYLSVVSNK